MLKILTDTQNKKNLLLQCHKMCGAEYIVEYLPTFEVNLLLI